MKHNALQGAVQGKDIQHDRQAQRKCIQSHPQINCAGVRASLVCAVMDWKMIVFSFIVL
jgi:hypothetical protein